MVETKKGVDIMCFLKVDHMTKNFGGLAAISNVNLTIKKNEILGLIGPNGAGKSTFFNLLTGMYQPSSGTITFLGKKINGLKPYEISRLGVGRTFQNIRLFSELTVLENIEIAFKQKKTSVFSEGLHFSSFYKKREETKRKAQELLSFFGLEKYKHYQAKSLPYGQQRRLEIARALATKPKLLFLDEPAAGMNPNETQELKTFIANIHRKFQLTIVLIEHDMPLVMELCDRICVLEYGRVLQIGTPQDIQNNPKVIAAYLGEGASV